MATRFQLARGSVVLGAIARGPSGAAATITAGTTTTSAEGTSAAVANSGSTSAAIFDFTIPRGAVPAIGFNFDTSTTDADPGAGDVRFNHATPASVTAIYFDNADRDGNTVTGWLDAMDDSTSTSKGHIVITPAASPDDKLVYSVSGTVVDGTGYRKVTVAHVAGTVLPSSGAHLAFEFSRTGDAGANGTMGGTLGSTDNLLGRADGTLGSTFQASGTLIDDSNNICPVTTDTGALGTSSLNWADLFLDSGAVINFDSGDVTITHSANSLAFAGASNGYSYDATVKPASNDGAALGVSGTAWADLFMASGGVINWDAGNYTLTHTAGVLTANGAFSIGTSNPLTAGTIELGAASDTTISRSAAGVIAVESVPLYSNIPQNSQSDNYTLVLSDAQKHIYQTGASKTCTIPANASVAYPIGTALTFITASNATTIAITSDTLTLAGTGTTGSRTLAANSVATAVKTTSTTWIISGAGLT